MVYFQLKNHTVFAQRVTLPTAAWRLAVDPASNYLFAASSGQLIYVVDIRSDSPTFHQVVGRITLPHARMASDGLAVSPDGRRLFVSTYEQVHVDGHIVVVNIDNKLDDEVLAKTGARIPFIGPDNRAGARKVGEAVAARLEPGDRVLVLEGIRTSLNGQQRRLGFEDAAKAAGLVIADSQSAQWEMNQANQVASAMLSSHPEAKAILAANDNMALGALAAVRSAGKGGSVLIAGFDNIGAVQQAIRSGDILATADQYGDRLAVYGIEYALQILAGQAEPADRETPVDLVTAESLSQP